LLRFAPSVPVIGLFPALLIVCVLILKMKPIKVKDISLRAI